MSLVSQEPAPNADEATDHTEVVAWAQDGRLVVVGEPTSVDVFVADLKPERSLDLAPLKALSSSVALLDRSGAIEPVKRYVELGAQRWRQIAPAGSTTSELRLVTRSTATGRFVANNPAGALKTVASAQPQVLIALAAIQMALKSLTEAVEEIAENVEDLKRIAETTEVGNLAGLYRVLHAARRQVDHDGTLPRTTWESIAPHEVTAQQSADRVRAYVRRVLDDLPVDRDAGERLKAAERLVSQGTLRRSLRLLVLAEQNRLLWRSLKLDRVRVAEPDALGSETDAATSLLAENAEADKALIAMLRERVDKLGRLGALDGARPWTPHRLPEARDQLREQVDQFAAARSQQLESWTEQSRPGIKDAAKEVSERAGAVAEIGRRSVGGWIKDVGTWVSGTPTAEPALTTADEIDLRDPGQLIFRSDKSMLGSAVLENGRVVASNARLQDMVDTMGQARAMTGTELFAHLSDWSNGSVHVKLER